MTSVTQYSIVICVASHIYYPNQLKLLQSCLKSLIGQTKQAEQIIVSISFDNEQYKKSFARDILKQFSSKVTFKFASSKLSQMQHIHKLSKFLQSFDLILFCDDDDTYHCQRTEMFSDQIEQSILGCAAQMKTFAGICESEPNIKLNEQSEKPNREFWAYGIPPATLNLFFHRIKGFEELLEFKCADMYFRTFLSTLNSQFGWMVFTPPVALYQYNQSNSNSICAKLEKNHKLIFNSNSKERWTIPTSKVVQWMHDQLLLCTITLNDSNYSKFKRATYMNDGMENIVFPEKQIVMLVCDKLYDIKP
eukprot:179677_1